MSKKPQTMKIKVHEAMLNQNLVGEEIICSIIKPMKPIPPDPFVRTSEFNARFDQLTVLVTNGFAQMNARFDGLEARVARLEMDMAEVKTTLKVHDEIFKRNNLH